MTSATVIGEALVDIVEEGDAERTLPGGSPLNVAVGLARLGVTVDLIAQLGSDQHGDLVREHAQSSGVGLSRIEETARTSSARATIADDGSASYVFDLTWTLSPQTRLGPTDLVHVGSVGSWLAPGEQTVARLVRERDPGQLASFDPNVRARLIDDRDAVVARIEALAAASDIVKLSDEDALWLYPHADPDAVLDRILELGASLAVITLAAEGSVGATNAQRVRRPARPTIVADTIGAGDSFMSGLLAGVLARGLGPEDLPLVETSELSDLLEFALACASVTVSRRGAEPPTLAELRAAHPDLAGAR